MSEQETQTEGQAGTAEGSLLDQIMQETRIKPSDDGYETAKKGVEAFIADLLEPQRKGEKIEQKVVDNMIAEIDKRIGKQVDEVIHHKEFQYSLLDCQEKHYQNLYLWSIPVLIYRQLVS